MSSVTTSLETPPLIDTRNYVLTALTTQVTPFKTLLTALKDIIMETNIIFTKEGIKLINVNDKQGVLVYLDLPCTKFEFYECKKEKLVINVNVTHLYRLITSLSNNEQLTLCIETAAYHDGTITELCLLFKNPENNQFTMHRLKLMQTDEDNDADIPDDMVFSSVIKFPATEFQKTIRSLSNIGDKVEIKSVGTQLIFKCVGRYASSEITRNECGEMEFVNKNNPTKIVQGVFSLKNLSYFIKCTNLCSHTKLYLDNDNPLVVEYDVAELGVIRLCTTPSVEKNMHF